MLTNQAAEFAHSALSSPLTNQARQFYDYLTDYMQRSILFMDILRQRGNEMLAMAKDNSSTVLNFKFEKLIDGAEFERPINYWLARMLPPEGVSSNPLKRPYVIQDPRAGQGPGIGGFKKDSEIGDALKNGHPVYFIGFNANPIEGQTYEDVISGQLKFYEKVAELHPDSPKMCAIGNCAAGYLSMFSAMQRPDIFGPILIAGSPLSYWNGERGKNPMRYAGGLIGGSWINSLLGDLGGGKFDGTYLIMNFDLLNPANFLWSKQYNLFANIDNDGKRYLEFEKWWGDFIQFNTPEIKWLVDKLFIGNQLTSGTLMTADGVLLDPRKITSPIITFVSDGDNISPPAQSAGWIADLYSDSAEIIASGKTIIYCLNHKVGHLAIFTATKVGQREDEVFIENMDSIDILPPGLYELIIDTPEGQETSGKLRSHYEARTIDDIKALGSNSVEDDRAFATVAKASEAFSLYYDKFIHPYFELFNSPEVAAKLKKFRPLRMSYYLFAESVNPFMSYYGQAATIIKQQRINLQQANPLLQANLAKFVAEYLQNHSDFRDKLREQTFFSIWSNPLIQKFWGTHNKVPRITASMLVADQKPVAGDPQQSITANLPITNLTQALIRTVVSIARQNGSVDEFAVRILVEEIRKIEPSLKDRKIHDLINDQIMIVRNDPEGALEALREFTKNPSHQKELTQILTEASQKISIIAPGKLAPNFAKIISTN